MASFATFRSRLIVLFALATFPAVALALALSWRVYDNAKEASQRAYLQAAQQVAMQERGIVQGALRVSRTLLAASADDLRDGECGDLSRVVEATRNYSAIAVVRTGGVVCGGGQLDAFDGFDVKTLLAPLTRTREDQDDHAVSLSGAGSRPLIAISLPVTGDAVVATVIDSAYLESVLVDIALIDRGSVAIVDPRSGVVIANGNAESSEDWLPGVQTVLASAGVPLAAAGARSRGGRDYVYAVQPIHEGAMAVVAGFPAARFGPAERQLAIGLGFPFVLFGIVLSVAWIAIDRLFLQWVGRLDATARRLAFGDFSVKAELPKVAPLELRQYARAFDQMTEVLGSRTRELATVAQQRSHLLRELHHRVKNNFQVIASFLNLMKRERTGETREALALAESRVHAMAAAYKLALAQGDIRLVSVPLLIQDVVNYIQHAADMHRTGVRLQLDSLVAFLDLDRAIPLALVLVETLWPLVTNPAGVGDGVTVVASRDGDMLSLRVEGPPDAPPLIGRFGRAFLHQIEATEIGDAPPGTVLAVTIPIDSGHDP